MADAARPYRRVVLVGDMERYSARSTVLQNEAQRVFLDALDAAAAAAGLDRDVWRRQSSGDGELAVLPPEVDEPALLSAFLLGLDRFLRPYNAHRRAEARIRVRIAVHQGLIFPGSRNGFAGEAVNTAARLVDAPVLKRVLKAFPEAAVACIVSEGIHRDVVTGGYDGIRPERFRRMRVTLADKDFDEWAWLAVVDEDVTRIDMTETGDGPGPVGVPNRPGEDPPAGPGDGATEDGATDGGIKVGNVRNKGQLAIGNGATAVGKVRHGR